MDNTITKSRCFYCFLTCCHPIWTAQPQWVDPVIFENSKIAEVLAEISNYPAILRKWEAGSAFDQGVLDDRYPEYPNKSCRLSLSKRQSQNWKLLFQTGSC